MVLIGACFSCFGSLYSTKHSRLIELWRRTLRNNLDKDVVRLYLGHAVLKGKRCLVEIHGIMHQFVQGVFQSQLIINGASCRQRGETDGNLISQFSG